MWEASEERGSGISRNDAFKEEIIKKNTQKVRNIEARTKLYGKKKDWL